MTMVDVLQPCVPDFGDLSKQLNLFDSLDAFTADEMKLLESGDFADDLFHLPAASEPAMVPTVDACWSFPPLAAINVSSDGAQAEPANASGFVKLEDLHTSSPVAPSASSAQASPTLLATPAAAASVMLRSNSGPSPASSGSHASYSFSPSDDAATSEDWQPKQKKDPRIGKRKPEVDLSSITDIAERRKQRRLAKNRATAAISRERKRKQMLELQGDNAKLQFEKTKLERENARLQQLLATRDLELAQLKGNVQNDAALPQRPHTYARQTH